MRSRLQLFVRAIAVSVIVAGYSTLSAAKAEAGTTCSGGFLNCVGHGFCNDQMAELYCQANGGPDCHQNGWDCVNWPFNGCGYGEDHPQYFCYGP